MNANAKILALVLGGGKGTRMKSRTAKVLQPVIDVPMLYYPLSELFKADLPVTVVVGHHGEDVKAYLKEDFPDAKTVFQIEQLGTGHAVSVAEDVWREYEHVLILPGDIPLIREKTIRMLVQKHFEEKNTCTFLSFIADDPTGYGRIVREGSTLRIVEESDASQNHKKIKEVNSGVYLFSAKSLAQALSNVDNSNSQKEFYLTDTVSTLHRQFGRVSAFICEDKEELEGVNSPRQLADVAGKVKKRIVEEWLEKGVKFTDPLSVHISPRANIAEDVYIEPFVQILGSTILGRNSFVGSFSQLKNTRAGAGSTILNHAIIHDSQLREDVTVGPFCFIRNSSDISEGAYIGKFVEIKKSKVGKRSKVPHLSYLGDAEVGEDTNIGAGTITCNYDGEIKHRTEIGNNCFIGSDTMLVAPVKLGDRASTAAGSVITSDVPEDAMAVARSRQRNIEGWTQRKKRGARKGQKGTKGAN